MGYTLVGQSVGSVNTIYVKVKVNLLTKIIPMVGANGKQMQAARIMLTFFACVI